jgi:phenylpropionate dioxygenase-like ring-hydroxylating dioxygenase large terminal subunit
MSPITIARRAEAATAVGLPLSWYFDPEILEIERRALFDAGPTYAGHQCLVPRDGDYAVRGGPQAGRVLVRSQGEVQLLSNVCRHRQAQLLTGCGHAKHIVCPIHNWAYNLDGCQVAAPFMGENPRLDLERTDVADWNGLLFTGPRDIRRELAPLDGWTELTGRDVVLERVDEEEHDLNWKAFLEVYLEDYHIGTVHPGFRAFVDPSDLHGALQFTGGERFFCEQVKVRWPLATAGSPLFAEYQKILIDVSRGRRPEFAAVWLCLFSGQLIEWYPHSFVVTTYTPLSPRRTRLRSEYYFDREIAESRRDYVECGLAVLDEVTGEDQLASEALENGRAAAYARGDNWQGPYQLPMEQGLKRFHDCLRDICLRNVVERAT